MLFQVVHLYLFYFQADSLRHRLSASFDFYSTMQFVIINAGSFVGRFAAGTLLPFVGVIDLTIVTGVVCALLAIGMIWLGSVASVVVLVVLYGLFAGISGCCIHVGADARNIWLSVANLDENVGRLCQYPRWDVLALLLLCHSVSTSRLLHWWISSRYPYRGMPGAQCVSFCRPTICGAPLTGYYLWWVPVLFCGAIALAGGILFVGVRSSFGHASAGGEWEIETGITSIPA